MQEFTCWQYGFPCPRRSCYPNPSCYSMVWLYRHSRFSGDRKNFNPYAELLFCLYLFVHLWVRTLDRSYDLRLLSLFQCALGPSWAECIEACGVLSFHSECSRHFVLLLVSCTSVCSQATLGRWLVEVLWPSWMLRMTTRGGGLIVSSHSPLMSWSSPKMGLFQRGGMTNVSIFLAFFILHSPFFCLLLIWSSFFFPDSHVGSSERYSKY